MPEGVAGAIAVFSTVVWKLFQAEMKYWHFLPLPVHLHEKSVLTTENRTVGQSFGGTGSHTSSGTRLLQGSLLYTAAPCGRGNTGAASCLTTITIHILTGQHISSFLFPSTRNMWGTSLFGESMRQDHTYHPRSPYGGLTDFLFCCIKQWNISCLWPACFSNEVIWKGLWSNTLVLKKETMSERHLLSRGWTDTLLITLASVTQTTWFLLLKSIGISIFAEKIGKSSNCLLIF